MTSVTPVVSATGEAPPQQTVDTGGEVEPNVAILRRVRTFPREAR